jgi:hypothetical protein
MRVTHGNRGFCNVNVEAVMIEYLRSHYGPLRVAVVDTDCHHGDGSQDIFWNDPNTLFISLHQDGRTLYPGSGFLRESGGPAALGRTINFALPPETGDEGYLYVIDNGVLPLLEAFKPDLIVNSAGQANHFTDPLANMRLSARGYAELNRRLSPHIAVLEGGYAIRGALPYTNLAICLALAGLPFDDIHEPDWRPDSARQSPRINDILKKHCADALQLFRNPPARPTEGHEERGFWIRHKDIFYDTDMLHEKQKEAFRLCPHCLGFGLYESASARTPLSLCVHIPRAACEACRAQAQEFVETGKKSGRYYTVLLNDQAG